MAVGHTATGTWGCGSRACWHGGVSGVLVVVGHTATGSQECGVAAGHAVVVVLLVVYWGAVGHTATGSHVGV